MTKAHRIENKPLAEAMRELRKSSAAQPHEDRRTRKARTRTTAKTKAINEYRN